MPSPRTPSLLFANWDTEHPDQFLAAARWARQQGARIISCSVVMPSCSDGEGKGEMHDKFAQLLGSGTIPEDMLCFASAGNTTVRHWCGTFHDAGNGYHEWQPGTIDNAVSPWGSERCSVELYWQPAADYDLSVRDAARAGRCWPTPATTTATTIAPWCISSRRRATGTGPGSASSRARPANSTCVPWRATSSTPRPGGVFAFQPTDRR